MLRDGHAVLAYHAKAPAPNPPPGARSGRRFYRIVPRNDGRGADVYLMPFPGVTLVMRGVAPFEGMEDDIRARYYAWCESAEVWY